MVTPRRIFRFTIGQSMKGIAALAVTFAILPMPAAIALAISATCVLLLRCEQRSLPIRFAALHTALISGLTAIYPTGLFTLPPYDDVFVAYMAVPGFHIYIPCAMFAYSLWPWLQTVLSYRSASLTCIIFIPGTLGLILGGIQWYMIGQAVVWYRRRRERLVGLRRGH
jgi:hypothetical protein